MNDEFSYETQDTSLNKKAELPLVWLLPICAFIVSGWLIYKSASEKGPVITIDFPTAEGLEIDKTKIRYLDVEIGKVTDININQDAKTIQVTAQMHHTAENYLNQNTSFWVVRPQVGLAGISGLNTLISGAYIEVKPGDGPHQHHFTGLPAAPVLKTEAKGRQFVLETANLGSLGPRTQINFHGIPVGEVLTQELSVHASSSKPPQRLSSISISACNWRRVFGTAFGGPEEPEVNRTMQGTSIARAVRRLSEPSVVSKSASKGSSGQSPSSRHRSRRSCRAVSGRLLPEIQTSLPAWI